MENKHSCGKIKFKKSSRKIHGFILGEEHIKEMMDSDLPFERYYHWCFTDNFEWLEGESARFGLVHVDFETQERTLKESGRFFTKIIEAKGVTQWMYETDVEQIRYDYNKASKKER